MQESGTGHVVVLRQFDGRRVIICGIVKMGDCIVELKSVVILDSTIEKREKRRRKKQTFSLFVALIP
jgi:hypothetical protein